MNEKLLRMIEEEMKCVQQSHGCHPSQAVQLACHISETGMRGCEDRANTQRNGFPL